MTTKPKILQTALAAITGELKKVRAEYEQTFTEIDKVKAEIKRLKEMPVSRADFSLLLKEHIAALKKYGPTPIHRRSFIGHFVG